MLERPSLVARALAPLMAVVLLVGCGSSQDADPGAGGDPNDPGNGGASGSGGVGGSGGGGGTGGEEPRTPVGDLSLARIEWGQSVIDNDPILVERKQALLRLYVIADQPDLRARVEAEVFDAGGSLGVVQLEGPATIPTSIVPQDLSKQFTTVLPDAWVRPGLRIEVTIDPDDQVPETDESNNRTTLLPPVMEADPLPVTVVPVAHSGLTGRVVDFEERMLQLWPVNGVDVEVRAPYSYTPGASGLDLEEILHQLFSLRRADGSDRYYLGMVPGVPRNGVVGIGYVGYPVAVAKDDSPDTPDIIAHELGHNFSLEHAPCGVSNYNRDYPYPDAKLGSWGWDYTVERIINPQWYADVMSYCEPSWVSDYHYRKAQEYLSSRQRSAAPRPFGDALLFAGTISGGTVRLQPMQRIRTAIEWELGPYSLVLRTASGREEVVPFAAWEVADVEEDEEAWRFAVVVPDPGSFHRLEIRRDGVTIHAVEKPLALRAAVEPPAILERDERLELTWDAQAFPHAAVAWLGEGERITLSLSLQGGRAVLPLQGIPAGGSFEVSLSDGLDAERFVFAR